MEALQDLQKSIELNNNRAVYRSRLLLDEDLAARSTSLARIYDDLGFPQLALVEGWRSLNADPSNYSAHRFLADSYAALPRHEIARVSELLQSQLLQPINITPVQPQLAESNLSILEGAGPANPSFNEFNSLFLRNRFSLQASGVAGGDGILGEELVQSAVWENVSYSIGQFHYETDGFRENNDQEQDIYNVFAQMSLSHKTSIQAEFRYKDMEAGDLRLRFDPDFFDLTKKIQERIRSTRLGFHHAFTPYSDIIGSVIYENADFDTHPAAGYDFLIDDNGYLTEIQHLFKSQRFHVTSGAGHFSADKKIVCNYLTLHPDVRESDIRHTNFYVYSLINCPKSVFWTVGGSFDFFEGVTVHRNQFNPKVGLTWNPLPDTTLRAAGFRALKRTLISSQTLEPTQVAGFNQFFDDLEGTESWRYGVGIDQKFSPTLSGGLEFSKRKMEVPLRDITLGVLLDADWYDEVDRAYLYWTPRPWLALSSEYQFQRFEREIKGQGRKGDLRTHRFPFGISFFHASGVNARLKATYIDQSNELTIMHPMMQMQERDDDQYWIVDAFIRYRLPKRRGFFTIGARNLFDEEFKYQDEDPANQVIYPERLIFARVTLTFDL